jgi:hypothetical protein
MTSGRTFSSSAVLVLVLTLFLGFNLTKSPERIYNGRLSVIVALKLDQRIFPSRNSRGLSLRPRDSGVPPSYKMKVGFHLLHNCFLFNSTGWRCLRKSRTSNPGLQIFRFSNNQGKSKRSRYSTLEHSQFIWKT